MDQWIRNKSDEQAVEDGCTFDLSYAERVRDFLYNYCRQSIGIWSGKNLELMPWQWSDLIAPLYGWRKGPYRRFRSACCFVPRNSGKSTLCSGLSLFHLAADGEASAQVVTLASCIEQAGIIYRGAADMIRQSPDLDGEQGGILWTRRNIKTVEFDAVDLGLGHCTYKVMSGERGGGKRGHPISFLTIDEICDQSDREVYDLMRQNCLKRNNSLMLCIGTAGYKTESIGKEVFDYASNIIKGEIIDTSFLPVVYAADPEDEWDALATFKKANPSYCHTVFESDYKILVNEARNEPRKQACYCVERLNRFTGYATQWISSTAWDACGEDFTEEELRSLNLPAWCGWDYG